jgi:6-pyruvoyltetrahydropterin/6-carboxytetrahydropterin synthase
VSYIIQKEIEFDAGHRVPLHESKCKNPHGHRYRVVAHIEGELITEGPESGMVRDFSIVKELLTKHVHDRFDHGFIVSVRDEDMLAALEIRNVDNVPYSEWDWKVIVVHYYPTAECLAKDIYDTLKPYLPNLLKVDVYETPTSCASYLEDVDF